MFLYVVLQLNYRLQTFEICQTKNFLTFFLDDQTQLILSPGDIHTRLQTQAKCNIRFATKDKHLLVDEGNKKSLKLLHLL